MPELLRGPADLEFSVCHSWALWCIPVGKEVFLGTYLLLSHRWVPAAPAELPANLAAWFLEGEQHFPSSFPSPHR